MFIPQKNINISKYTKIFLLAKLKENRIEVVYTIKPLWGDDDVLKPILHENCIKKTTITDILVSHLLLKCSDLNN